MRTSKLLSIIFVGIFGSIAIALSCYFVSLYWYREENHRFEAAEILDEGYFDYVGKDLGVINPGETVEQDIPVVSKLDMEVNLSFTFVGEESELGNYLTVSINGFDELNGHTLNENIANKDGKFTYKRSLLKREKVVFTFKYTLLDGDDAPISTALDFKIRFNAVNNPYLFGR